MTETQPKPGVIPWPPVIYTAAIAVSIILGMLYPLPWIGDLLGDILFAAGWVALFGVAVLWFTAPKEAGGLGKNFATVKTKGVTMTPYVGGTEAGVTGRF